jgi:hypothetical protein
MTKKQKTEMRLQILKESGKAGLKAFDTQQRETGRMRMVQVHSSAAYDAHKGYRRKPKHRNRGEE